MDTSTNSDKPRVRRVQLTGVQVAVLLICAIVSSAALFVVFDQRSDMKELKSYLKGRCEVRNAQDIETKNDLQERIDLYDIVIASDRALLAANTEVASQVFIDRMAGYQHARAAAVQRLNGIRDPQDCQKAYAAAR